MIAPLIRSGFGTTALLLDSCASRSPLLPGEAKPAQIDAAKPARRYHWTNDHMQVGVPWHPYGLAVADAYGANRPVITKDSSYVQFWVIWAHAEPERGNEDYKRHMSEYLR